MPPNQYETAARRSSTTSLLSKDVDENNNAIVELDDCGANDKLCRDVVRLFTLVNSKHDEHSAGKLFTYDPEKHLHNTSHADFSHSVGSNIFINNRGARAAESLIRPYLFGLNMTEKEISDYVVGRNEGAHTIICLGLQQLAIIEWANSIGSGSASELVETNRKFKEKIKQLEYLLRDTSLPGSPFYHLIVRLQNLHLSFMSALGKRIDQLHARDAHLAQLVNARDELWLMIINSVKSQRQRELEMLYAKDIYYRAKRHVLTFVEIFMDLDDGAGSEAMAERIRDHIITALNSETKEYLVFRIFLIGIEFVRQLGDETRKALHVFTVRDKHVVETANKILNEYREAYETPGGVPLNILRHKKQVWSELLSSATFTSVPFGDANAKMTEMIKKMRQTDERAKDTKHLIQLVSKCMSYVDRNIFENKMGMIVQRIDDLAARYKNAHATRQERSIKHQLVGRALAKAVIQKEITQTTNAFAHLVPYQEKTSASKDIQRLCDQLNALARENELNVKAIEEKLRELNLTAYETINTLNGALTKNEAGDRDLRNRLKECETSLHENEMALRRYKTQLENAQAMQRELENKPPSNIGYLNERREKDKLAQEALIKKLNDKANSDRETIAKLRDEERALDERLRKLQRERDALADDLEKAKDIVSGKCEDRVAVLTGKLNDFQRECDKQIVELTRGNDEAQQMINRLKNDLRETKAALEASERVKHELEKSVRAFTNRDREGVQREKQDAEEALSVAKDILKQEYGRVDAIVKLASTIYEKRKARHPNPEYETQVANWKAESKSYAVENARERDVKRKNANTYFAYFQRIYHDMLGFKSVFIKFRPFDKTRYIRNSLLFRFERNVDEDSVTIETEKYKRRVRITNASENLLSSSRPGERADAEDLDNTTIFEQRVKPRLKSLSRNTLIMAYGQSGSGKTRLILGEMPFGINPDTGRDYTTDEQKRGYVDGLLGLTLDHYLRDRTIKNVKFRAFQYYLRPGASGLKPNGTFFEIQKQYFDSRTYTPRQLNAQLLLSDEELTGETPATKNITNEVYGNFVIQKNALLNMGNLTVHDKSRHTFNKKEDLDDEHLCHYVLPVFSERKMGGANDKENNKILAKIIHGNEKSQADELINIVKRNILEGLFANRIKRVTRMNPDGSSRSHIFFLIRFEDTADTYVDAEGRTMAKVKNVIFCDMGGSENAAETADSQRHDVNVSRLRVYAEGKMINDSLETMFHFLRAKKSGSGEIPQKYKTLNFKGQTITEFSKEMSQFMLYFLDNDSAVLLFLLGQQFARRNEPSEDAVKQTTVDLFKKMEMFYGNLGDENDGAGGGDSRPSSQQIRSSRPSSSRPPSQERQRRPVTEERERSLPEERPSSSSSRRRRSSSPRVTSDDDDTNNESTLEKRYAHKQPYGTYADEKRSSSSRSSRSSSPYGTYADER